MTDKNFAKSLADFLAFHTDQSAAHLHVLINAYLRGVQGGPSPDPAAQKQLMARLQANVAANNDVPTFLQNYLYGLLTGGAWSAQANFIALRYLRQMTGERLVPWQQRQQAIADLADEPLRGSELDYRQMLYSQGVADVFHWRGAACFKSHYDLCIYMMLLDELRPGAIVELGSGTGGSALFLADISAAMGLTTRIISVDNTPAAVADPRVEFIRSDCGQWLSSAVQSGLDLPRPVLMIEDFHGDLADFVEPLDAMLQDGDYLVVEDSYDKQSRIAQTLAKRPYLIDTRYTDFFGINCTSAINGIFVKAAASR
jgi:cephalosporin hydroxylase